MNEMNNVRQSIAFAQKSHRRLQSLQSLQLEENNVASEMVPLEPSSSTIRRGNTTKRDNAGLFDSQVPLPVMIEDEAAPPSLHKSEDADAKGDDGKEAGSLLPVTREIDHGNLFMLQEFFWPSVYFEREERIGQDRHTLEHLSKIVYPARIYGAAYLGLLGILAEAYIYRYWYRRVGNFISDVKQYKEQLEALQPPSSPMGDDADSSGQDWAVNATANTITFAEALHQGLLWGGIYSVIFGLFACILLFRAWKKKMVNLRKGTPLHRYEPKMFPTWATTRFMSTVASYIATGAFLNGLMLCFWATMFGWNKFWNWLHGYTQMIIGYFVYVCIDHFVIKRWLLNKIMVAKDGSVKHEHEEWFQYLLPLLDFMYLPLALLYGMYRMLNWFEFYLFIYLFILFLLLLLLAGLGIHFIVLNNKNRIIFALLSYLRPDLNMYPRGLENFDYGHLTFVSSIRLMVEREAVYLSKEFGPMMHKRYRNVQGLSPGASLGMFNSFFFSPAPHSSLFCIRTVLLHTHRVIGRTPSRSKECNNKSIHSCF
ncbi:hypothetical protein RFI_26653 [Reticulomyxa filosa]|uniref:Uncharacterized protein n=1 Tax=Reticulomyxa filosa TaxID=46433 RepID=X6MA01_RETFI|nr:hypothetical protein RFI_26653 [Reticulomyxa filosa]|eukprot:ETO10724.1 hypothetical protein RFI_26653 [Reticulomyxa filosa]